MGGTCIWVEAIDDIIGETDGTLKPYGWRLLMVCIGEGNVE